MYKEVYGIKKIERYYRQDYSSPYGGRIEALFCYKVVKAKLIKHVIDYFEDEKQEYYILCPYNEVRRNIHSQDCVNGFISTRVFESLDDAENYCSEINKMLWDGHSYKFQELTENERNLIISRITVCGDLK